MATSTERKPNIQKLLSVLFMLAVLAYGGYQAYRSIFSSIRTEMATEHSVYESIEAQGIVFRTETVIPSAKSGYIYYTVDNGTHVSKNGVIASVYSQADDGLLEQQIAEIDDEIDTLHAIQEDNTYSRLTLDMVNNQIVDVVNGMVRQTESGSFGSLSDAKTELLTLMSKKKLITGEKLDFSAAISSLQSERQRLQSSFHKAIASVRAPVAGYFANKTDGFENILAKIDPKSLTVADVQKYLSMEAAPVANTCGKIVSGYVWYIACVVPDSYYNTLTVDKSLTLQLSFVTEDPIPVTVVACNKDNNGNLAVVFCSTYMSAELSTIRNENVQIQLVRHNGLKVPKRAIVVKEDRTTGVYIRSGNVVSFRKIEQEYSEPADYVICKNMTKSGYLRLYDDIIVGGKNLYDGKIIR